MKKLVILNAGSYTEAGLAANFSGEVERHLTRELAISLSKDNVSIFHNNEPLKLDNCILYNRFERDLKMVGLVSEYAEYRNGHIINPITLSYQDAHAKTAQILRCAMAGLGVPNTIITEVEGYKNNRTAVHEKITFPLIAKTDGKQGEQVHLIKSEGALEELLETVPKFTVLTLQEYIQNDGDMRLLIVFGECIGAIKRSNDKHEYLNNISQGGKAEHYEPTNQEVTLATNACTLNRTDVAGVDIIHQEGKPLFLELNQGFGVEGYESIHTDKSVMEFVGQHITKHFKNH